ncbi:syndecan isoform X4 [Scaptodrosophila lebanonensis]|uniref:Syndecan n=1 Tax=Drosophila lebanonensis TaxID=7225 RepID=A0A6J2T8G2_DROLE|nr:syndecan isoform X4 [Scaptodrosophila lebanonensis]
MQSRNHMLILMLIGLFMAAIQAADEKSVKSSLAAPSSTSATKDEIYIDDDSIDGSGGRSGVHDDLDKEADYSGSGFGPDDEDAITDHHSSHNSRVHNTQLNANTNTGTTNIQGNIHELDPNNNINSQPTDTKPIDHTPINEVVIMSDDDRTTSFFAQPGILAAVIGGAVVGLLCAILVVMFIVYRMRKKDEGSYALDEPKRSPANNSYAKNANNREFYA